MSNLTSKIALLTFLAFLIFNLTSCKDQDSILLSDEISSSDKEALEKLVEEDESLESFDLNYDEGEAMNFILGKTSEEIYPVRIGQKMKLVERDMNIVFEDDMAYGTLVKTFEGILFIAASSEPLDEPGEVDLNVYEKPFETTITRNIIFEKVRNTDYPLRNWKISSISLPVGGTLTENIDIEKLTVYLPDGETLIIESPLDYYLSRGPSLIDLIPHLNQFEIVGVEVDIKSLYEEEDFVSLTYGALRGRTDTRMKTRFEFDESSERFDGKYYYRTYKGEWVVNQFKGLKHAVINAMPYGVIKDSEAPVETSSWGVPYIVN
jgi:hypothetical protein